MPLHAAEILLLLIPSSFSAAARLSHCLINSPLHRPNLSAYCNTMPSLNPTASLIGTALLYSGMQFALASVEQSSKYSVENFSKDQQTLQAASNALSTYIIIAVVWTVACCLVLYGDYGARGVLWGLITNAIFILWIVISYWLTFRKVARTNGLQMPKWFGFSYNPSPIARQIK